MPQIELDLNSENDIFSFLNELKSILSSTKNVTKYYDPDNDEYLFFEFGKKIGDEFEVYEPKSPIFTSPPEDLEEFGNDSEALFFQKVLTYPKGQSAMEKIIEAVILLNPQIGGFTEMLYKDEQEAFGLTPICLLVLNDIKYCDHFGRFLLTNDMDHEVYQYDVVSMIINKYGYTKETLKLLAIRMFSACGQRGDEQLNELLEKTALDQILGNKEKYNYFFDEAKYELMDRMEFFQETFAPLHLENSFCIENPNSNATRLLTELNEHYKKSLDS